MAHQQTKTPTFHLAMAMILAFGAISACGGNAANNGPGQPIPSAVPPTPPPTPPAPPPPPPPTVSLAEFNAQPGLAQINTLPAFNADILGEGALIAIIDTGIDIDDPEFAGRIDPRSDDLAIEPFVDAEDARPGGPSLQDTQGHGTSVASIAAAGANGQGLVGVAPEATILAFRGNLEDDPDTPDENESLTILGGAITEGVIRAVDANADVINLSLGSDEDGALDGFTGIVDFAGFNDVVTILSAGNQGPDSGQPQASAQSVSSMEARGTAIAVGAVDANNRITSFSNVAGDSAEFFIVAPGLGIPTVDVDGGFRPFSGTSASAPHVAGAVALIRGLWPQLTAAETVEIILDTATDLGAVGTDPIFGRGLLNVGAALEPSGALSVSTPNGQTVSVAALANTLSGPFGGTSFDVGPVVGLDRFGRDFSVSLDGLSGQSDTARFALGSAVRPFQSIQSEREALPTGGSLTFQLSETDPRQRPDQATLFRDINGSDIENAAERRLALSFTQPLGLNGSQFTLSQGFSPRQVDRLSSLSTQQNTLSRSAFSDAFLPDSVDAVTSILALGNVESGQFDLLASSVAPGDVPFLNDPLLADPQTDLATVSTVRLGYTRQISRATLRIETGFQDEPDTILGAWFADGFFGEQNGTETVYSAFAGKIDLSSRISLLGRYSLGFSQLPEIGASGLVTSGSTLRSSQFSLGLQGTGLFARNDQLSLSISQPLQVRSGGLTLTLPTGFDQQSEQVSFSTISTDFGSSARQFDLEAAYALPSLRGVSFLLNGAVGLTGFGAGETAVALSARTRF